MRKIYYFWTILLLVGCGHFQNLKYSADFYLIYEDGVDEINLKDETLTRRFIGEDSTITLKITDQEKRRLFQDFK